MESTVLRAAIGLGVPGFALAVLYLLYNKFNFQFEQIPPTYSALIAGLFLVIVGFIVWYALGSFKSPSGGNREGVAGSKNISAEFQYAGEVVTCTELMRGSSFDVVKIEAHTHHHGVDAEYKWLAQHYPGSRTTLQYLTTLEGLRGEEIKKSDKHFDVLEIVLASGLKKKIYFDISSFFNSAGTSMLNTDGFVAEKISRLYQQ